MSGNMNAFITYLFSHDGIDPQDSRRVSDYLHLTTVADILQITDAKLRDVPGLSAWYRERIVGAAWVYRRVHGHELLREKYRPAGQELTAKLAVLKEFSRHM